MNSNKYSKKILGNATPTGKSSRGSITVESVNGRLRLRFRVSGSSYVITLGVSESPENWKLAELKAKEVETDILFKQFNPSNLNKYKLHNLDIVDTSNYTGLAMKQLWVKYLEYKSKSIKSSTLDYLEKGLGKFIESCPTQDLIKSLEIREWLLNNTTTSMTKRVLTHVSASVNWGIKNNLITITNGFEGMSNDLPKHNWEENPQPNAFSEEEKEIILFAFQDHKGNWNGKIYTGCSYFHYYPFVKFLFLTGCRPSEAIGLEWKNIINDCSQIIFETSIVRIRGKATRMQGSKNNKIRKFNCNEELQTLLKVHQPLKVNPNSLVFPAPKGGVINYGNFSQVAWKKLITPLIKRSSTPYCCRDTFISEQIAKGVPTAVVAKWVDNSVDVIEKRYLDSKLLEQLKPL